METPAFKRFLMIIWFAAVIGIPIGLLARGSLWGWLFVPAGFSSIFLFFIFWSEGVIDDPGDTHAAADKSAQPAFRRSG